MGRIDLCFGLEVKYHGHSQVSFRRYCGIRYNPGFGHELRGVSSEFTRALNARSIMSNSVPEIDAPEDVPYCIWHPQTASEDNYRKLVRAYPYMAYHVGRACAVAGYTALYQELEILHEVHIAEEARECGSTAIFEDIISKPMRYSVMNDYTRSIDTANPQSAHLNGDTAVRWSLDIKQAFGEADIPDKLDGDDDIYGITGSPGFDEQMFNITEDMHIDQFDTEVGAIRKSGYDIAKLMYERLPRDLPTVDKDLLILVAAYYGDIDRYARLRRPKIATNELQCCVRGVYHNTMFAVWWSKQSLPQIGSSKLKKAIDARFIMNNVLSRVRPEDRDFPYLI